MQNSFERTLNAATDFEDAVTRIVKQQLNEVRYDTTQIGIIQGRSDRSLTYQVELKKGIVEATVADKDKEYQRGDQVYVLIPGDSILGMPTIIGIASIVPLVDMSQKITGINRITPKYKTKEALEHNVNSSNALSTYFSEEDIKDLILYCRNGVTGLQLEAIFYTNLQMSSQVFDFLYGIQLDIEYTPISIEGEEQTAEHLYLTFDSNEMTGTVFNVNESLPLKQEKIFFFKDVQKDINTINIQNITASLYSSNSNGVVGTVTLVECVISGVRDDLDPENTGKSLGLIYTETEAPATIKIEAEIYDKNKLLGDIIQWSNQSVVELTATEEDAPENDNTEDNPSNSTSIIPKFKGTFATKKIDKYGFTVPSIDLTTNQINLDNLITKVTRFQCTTTAEKIEEEEEEITSLTDTGSIQLLSKDIALVKPANWYEGHIIPNINENEPSILQLTVLLEKWLTYNQIDQINQPSEINEQNENIELTESLTDFSFNWKVYSNKNSIAYSCKQSDDIPSYLLNINRDEQQKLYIEVVDPEDQEETLKYPYDIENDILYCIIQRDYNSPYCIFVDYKIGHNLLYTRYVVTESVSQPNLNNVTLLPDEPNIEDYPNKVIWKITYYSDGIITYEIIAGPKYSLITVEITSSTGDIYINNNIDTILIPTIFDFDLDISDRVPAYVDDNKLNRDDPCSVTEEEDSAFYWYTDTFDDKGNWTAGTAPISRARKIRVQSEDINRKAVYRCDVDISKIRDSINNDIPAEEEV